MYQLLFLHQPNFKLSQPSSLRSQWTPDRSTKSYRPVPFPVTPTSKAEPGKIENENVSSLSTKDGESGKLEWKTERSESGQVRFFKRPNGDLFCRISFSSSRAFPNISISREKRR